MRPKAWGARMGPCVEGEAGGGPGVARAGRHVVLPPPLPDGDFTARRPLPWLEKVREPGHRGRSDPMSPHEAKVESHVASEATGVSGLAGRYAAALFDLADQQKALDLVAADLATLDRLIVESPDLARLLRSPLLGRAQQGAALAALGERAGLSPLARSFIGVVAHKRRLFALQGMIRGYHKLLADRRGEVTAEVTAAQALTPGQIDAVTDRLKRAVGAKVAVEIRVDPAILGGLVVKVGSRMVDGSLRSKLQRLRLAMRGI